MVKPTGLYPPVNDPISENKFKLFSLPVQASVQRVQLFKKLQRFSGGYFFLNPLISPLFPLTKCLPTATVVAKMLYDGSIFGRDLPTVENFNIVPQFPPSGLHPFLEDLRWRG